MSARVPADGCSPASTLASGVAGQRNAVSPCARSVRPGSIIGPAWPAHRRRTLPTTRPVTARDGPTPARRQPRVKRHPPFRIFDCRLILKSLSDLMRTPIALSINLVWRPHRCAPGRHRSPSSSRCLGLEVGTRRTKGGGPGGFPGTNDLDFVEECSVGGLILVERLAGCDRVVVLDSIRTQNNNPGDWYSFTASALRPNMNRSGVHDAELATALEPGRRRGLALPQDDQTSIFAVGGSGGCRRRASSVSRARRHQAGSFDDG